MKHNRYKLFAALWFVASVYALLLMPPDREPPPFPGFDKIAHMGLFFGQTWLWGKSFVIAGRIPPFTIMLAALFAWAGISEIFQAAFTERMGDIFDFVADLAGVFFAFIALNALTRAKLPRNDQEKKPS